MTCPYCGLTNIPEGTEICPQCYCPLSSEDEKDVGFDERSDP